MIKNRKLILLIVIMMVFITNIQAEEGIGFDWSIPARFGSDTNDDGLIDYKASPEFYDLDEEEALSAAQRFINPDTWTINFDACKSGEKFDIVEYQWEIDGKLISKEETCDSFSYKFHDKKTHVVQLTVLDMMGNKTTVQEQVKVKDWLIIGVGDSYGSGEGIPDIPISVDAIEEWQKAQNDLIVARKNLEEESLNLLGANSDRETIQKNVDRLIALTQDWKRKVIKSGECKLISLGFPFTIRKWIKEGCIGNNTALTKVTGQIGDAVAVLSFNVTPNPLNPAGTLITITNMGKNSIEVAKQAIETIKARKKQIEASIPAFEDLVDRYNGKVQPIWQNRQCHQSAFSSQAQAALNLLGNNSPSPMGRNNMIE